jgi:hypothetical protein
MEASMNSNNNKNGSYFIPREQIYPFFNPGAMNNEEGASTSPGRSTLVSPGAKNCFNPEFADKVDDYLLNVTGKRRGGEWVV